VFLSYLDLLFGLLMLSDNVAVMQVSSFFFPERKYINAKDDVATSDENI